MQSSGKGLHRARIRRQSGSVAMLGALWLMIAVICLATIDIGNVFWQKRELQKIADLAALAGAAGDLDNGFCQSGSANNSKSNGYEKTPESYPGNWTPTGSDNKAFFKKNINPYNACYVKVTRNVPFFFILGSSDGREVVAEATAKQTRARVAKIGARSKALEINSKNSPILDSIIGGLLGGNLQLDVLSWNGIANANVSLLKYLDALAIDLSLDAGDYNKLLDAKVSIDRVFRVLVKVVSQDETLGLALGALNEFIRAGVKLDKLTLKIGDLINLSSPANGAALDTKINVLDLVKASLQLANKNHALELDVPVDLKIAKLWINLKITEAPQFALGDPEYQDLHAKNEQVELTIFLSDLSKLTVLEVQLGAATGEANFEKRNYSCGPDKYLIVSGNSSLASIQKLKLSSLGILLLDTSATPGWLPSNIPLAEGSIDNYSFNLKNNPPLKNIQDPLVKEDWKSFDGKSNIASGLLNAIYSVVYSLLPGVLPLVKDLVVGILKSLLFPIELLLNEILNLLLSLLGISLSVGEISGQLTCGYSSELVY